MKKRKPPIVLISIIILMLIGVAIMNSPSNDKKSDDVVQNARDTDSPESMASSQKNLVNKADLPKSKVHSPMSEEMDDRPKGGVPAIKVAKAENAPKQTPNDNSQIGQWYSDQSATQNPKGITVTSPPH